MFCFLRHSAYQMKMCKTVFNPLVVIPRNFSNWPITSKSHIVGRASNQYLDLSHLRIGQALDIPYELTITEGWVDIWHSIYYQHDRLYTSTPFAQSLGFKKQLLPFSFMLFQCCSMSHIDEDLSILDAGVENAVYIRPAYTGDTFKKSFYVKGLKDIASGDAQVVTIKCLLHNQHHKLCFTVDKVMLWPGHKTSPTHRSKHSKIPSRPAKSALLRHIVDYSDQLSYSTPLAPLRVGDLLLHGLARPTMTTGGLALGTLFRQAHPLVMNLHRYKEDGLLVPGPLILSLAMAAESRSLFEVLYETIDHCRFINKAGPLDVIGAMTYIESITPYAMHTDLEEVKLTTVGLKNVEVATEFEGMEFPPELFQPMKKSELENFIEAECPLLADKIVVIAQRTIVRQSPHTSYDMPLL